jgi:hypothetical protein
MRFAVLAAVASASGYPAAFSSSNLPILVIDTGGKEIPDDPEITARLGVIDNHPDFPTVLRVSADFIHTAEAQTFGAEILLIIVIYEAT